MNIQNKPITIVGGGLAGLALGIALRRTGCPVTVWEAGYYPRHRVCGEFVSGEGVDVLKRAGLLEKFLAAGGLMAKTAAFFTDRRTFPILELPRPALCLSRHVMDDLLAHEFEAAGGKLKPQERWKQNEYGEGIVRATGRRVQSKVDGWRWIALKAHAAGVAMQADLEMHFLPEGYVGLCRIAPDKVNVCGLFRSARPLPELSQSWRNALTGPSGSPLQERLGAVEWIEESFCSVAGISVTPRRAADWPECCVGDAVTMIPPLTGNGMSMAFESAELAAQPLAFYARGEFTWEQARSAISAASDARFAQRLRWASRLNQVLFRPGAASLLLRLGSRWTWVWRTLFHATR